MAKFNSSGNRIWGTYYSGSDEEYGGAVDGENLRVRKIDTFGFITTVAGTGTVGFSPDGSKADTSKLTMISTIAIDTHNNLYFYDDKRIRKIDANTRIINTIAGTGVGGFSGDGGPATAAKIAGGGIAVDTAGNLFLADISNMRIRKIDKDGIITTIAGTGDAGFEGDGGDATAAKLKFPQLIAVNMEGDVFFSDVGNKRIRMITNKPVGISAISNSAKTGISIIPNPASGTCTITVNSLLAEQAVIIITDINGREVLRKAQLTNTPFHVGDHLSTGNYIVTATAGTQQFKEKMIIQ